MGSGRISTRRWVKCPICHEDHMPFEMEEDTSDEGWGYITCLNLSCPSNAVDDRAELLVTLTDWRAVRARGRFILLGFAAGVTVCITAFFIF